MSDARADGAGRRPHGAAAHRDRVVRRGPSTDDENRFIDKKGYDGYGQWHLGIAKGASEQTKGRFGFPYGDSTKVNRAGLIHAQQRASQNDHDDIVHAAGDLLQRIDDRES